MAAVRKVNIAKGQTVQIHTGRGAGALVIEVERFASGAVEIRNGKTGNLLRQWSPKEARDA